MYHGYNLVELLSDNPFAYNKVYTTTKGYERTCKGDSTKTCELLSRKVFANFRGQKSINYFISLYIYYHKSISIQDVMENVQILTM